MNNTATFDFSQVENEQNNAFAKYLAENSDLLEFSKDFEVGQIYDATPIKINYDKEYLELCEQKTKTNMYVSFKDLLSNIEEIKEGNIPLISLYVTKVTNSNEIFASEKKSFEQQFKNEISEHYKNNRFFKVKYTKIVSGGFMASYKDVYEVFVPGSLAGANVILDFKKYLNTERLVMVDNYDKDNKLFIVSFKKYLNKSLPYKIKNELDINKKYSAHLTAKPYDFGMFLEFEDCYTGLLHSSEFQNWQEEKKNYKVGDSLDVYVKEITKKDGKYRVILTTNQLNTNQDLLKWDGMRNALKSKLFNYTLNGDQINILPQKEESIEPLSITVDPTEIQKLSKDSTKIKIRNVDILEKRIDFDFVQ